MPVIAVTGGIGSGKSTVSRRLGEHGAVVVDADEIVRDVQRAGSPVLNEIRAFFGDDVIAEDGELDRRALGAIVFSDDDARARLNEIVHPAVRRESERRFSAAVAADPSTVVVYDVPLLAEARAGDAWDLVAVVHAPADVRTERLRATRGMTATEARARIAAQASDDERLRLADIVIDTSGTLAHTLAQADALWDHVTALGPRPGPH